MNWIARVPADRRRQVASLPAMIEVLETRTLLADGITPAAGAHLNGTAGVALTSVVVASFTVTDPSVNGAIWRAKVDWGDHSAPDKNVLATALPNGSFEFLDSHTYAAAGTYTVTVMIAQPLSHKPNDNTVTTQVTVTAPTPTPTPSPTPPPSIGAFQSSGLTAKAKVNKTFRASVARFSDPHTKPQQFSAVIDWGDQSGSTPGQIRRNGNGRYLVAGVHRYGTPGTFQVTVTIRDATGDVIAAHSSGIVTGKTR
jgi:hypothetical protein